MHLHDPELTSFFEDDELKALCGKDCLVKVITSPIGDGWQTKFEVEEEWVDEEELATMLDNLLLGLS